MQREFKFRLKLPALQQDYFCQICSFDEDLIREGLHLGKDSFVEESLGVENFPILRPQTAIILLRLLSTLGLDKLAVERA